MSIASRSAARFRAASICTFALKTGLGGTTSRPRTPGISAGSRDGTRAISVSTDADRLRDVPSVAVTERANVYSVAGLQLGCADVAARFVLNHQIAVRQN